MDNEFETRFMDAASGIVTTQFRILDQRCDRADRPARFVMIKLSGEIYDQSSGRKGGRNLQFDLTS